MTEAEWLVCEDPERMLGSLLGKASERKLRLFACACCRRLGRLLTQPRISKSLFVAEGHADGGSSHGALADANHILAGPFLRDFDGVEAVAAATATHPEAASAAKIAANVAALEDAPPHWAVPLPEELSREHSAQAALLRDMFGNPSVSPLLTAWLTPAVKSVALAAYEERELPSGHLYNARLAVLSDALEEAGCADEAILSHIRSPGPHVRGCWALDLILGKE